MLASLRARYDQAAVFGQIHNRRRDRDDGNHPAYTLACWLTDYADQVWLFATAFDLQWTNNASETAIKDLKRHQAVSGYWRTQAILGRYCRIRSTPPWPINPGCPPSQQPAIRDTPDGHSIGDSHSVWVPLP